MLPIIDVIALGGNAVLPAGYRGTIAQQLEVTRKAMLQVVSLLEHGRTPILTHGNGPVVGNIVVRNEAAKHRIPPMPLDVCGADSQGGMGYMIQQTLRNVMLEKGFEREVAAIITQVVVDGDDPGFHNPTKPIGPYFTREEAESLRVDRGWALIEDQGRGYRRVVASPQPQRILELPVVSKLVEQGVLVITLGGGGIPVVFENGAYRGREAVIDKDLSSALLASRLGAERLIMLTDTDGVYDDFGTRAARRLESVSVEAMRERYDRGAFPPGNMGPKILAAISFLEQGGKAAIVCRPDQLLEATNGRQGTTILASVGRNGVTTSVRE